ncbi:alpha/beta fold hydrolase [Streptomyces sp. NPDC006368]|uniref:thioesterase II family protein n=1 Tax=Streptomyces sp. NPDC006368 TaxID=3156760 RepID=UPI0033B4F54E
MDNTWFRRFAEPAPDAPALVCFPHAGGAASAYAPLARLLAGRLDVLAVQYPGRQDRRGEAPAGGILDLAAAVAERLPDGTGRPYAFFGHSMGALVAYETARILGGRSVPAPVRLFLSGRGAPGTGPNRHDRLGDDRAILAAVRVLGGTDASVLDDPELVDMVLPALRADYGALASYTWQPGPALDIPITVLVGDSDPVVPVSSVAGWAQQTRLDNDVRVFTGGHFYLSDQLAEVAGTIVGHLETRHGGRSGIQDSGPAGSIGGRTDTGSRGVQAARGARSPAPAGEPGGGHQRTAGRTLA